MSGFDERERAEEARFRHDLELTFRIRNRRNKLLGLWVAREHLGLTGEAAADYAKAVVMADFEAPGDADVMRKIEADLAQAGRAIEAGAMKAELARLEQTARREVGEE